MFKFECFVMLWSALYLPLIPTLTYPQEADEIITSQDKLQAKCQLRSDSFKYKPSFCFILNHFGFFYKASFLFYNILEMEELTLDIKQIISAIQQISKEYKSR